MYGRIKLLALLPVYALAGCVTLSGTYEITAYDAEGQPIQPQLRMIAEGRGVYPVRNAICMRHPGATIITVDVKTGQEHPSESPHHCR